jgi:hypothetical protein
VSGRGHVGAAAAVGVVLAVVLGGCAPADAPQAPGGAGTTTPSTPAPLDRSPTAVGEAHESELPPGGDEPGDVPVVPVGALDGAALRDLLRIGATSDPVAGACASGQLSASLRFTDAALGHRFGLITVTNDGPARCVLRGYPGLGARGAWGNPFLIEAEQRAVDTSGQSLSGGDGYTPEPVPLEAGESTQVLLEWTGALGGAASEPLGDLLLQPFHGTDPIPVTGAAEEAFDLSMATTVRIGPFAASAD